MISPVIRAAQKLRDHQRKLRDEDTESDIEYFERLAAEDEWLGGIYYKSNSISWTHSKAERYRADLGKVWDALQEIGIFPDGQTHAADAIRQFAMRRPSLRSNDDRTQPAHTHVITADKCQ